MEKTSARKWFLKYLPAAILTLAGTAGGYLYYRFVGCASGACPITANPVLSTLYGGAIGFLTGSIVTPDKGKRP